MIGWDGLGVLEKEAEDANGGVTLLCLKYSSQPVELFLVPPDMSAGQRQPVTNLTKTLFSAEKIDVSWWSVRFWEREITGEAVAWLHYECPLSLWLLHGSVLDYGSPLLYVITNTSNSVWQLWPGLKTLNSYIFVYLSASFVSVKSFPYFSNMPPLMWK